jgi:hypothetical protein
MPPKPRMKKDGRSALTARRLGPPLPGHVLLDLDVDPGVLQPNTALEAAVLRYEAAFPNRGGPTVAPLQWPLVMRATFTFKADDDDRPGRLPAGENWYPAEPDLQELVMVLKGVLWRRGYLLDEAHVSLDVSAKRLAAAAGVRVYLRTLLGPGDVGAEMPFVTRADRGHIHPLPLEAERGDAGEQSLAAAAAKARRNGGGKVP